MRPGSGARTAPKSARASFNAILRDYGRLGMLLANDGALGGKQIVPKDYLLDATDWHRQPDAFAPRKATPYFGYGYQFWLFPGEKRRFALLGVYGQSIFVDPELKLVMVITAAAKNASVGKEPLWPRARRAVARGRRAVRELVALASPAHFFFGPSRGTHLSRGQYARRRHLRARDFLDLAGRAGAVIDQHALAEPKPNDVLFARDTGRSSRAQRRGAAPRRSRQQSRMRENSHRRQL